MAERRRRPPIVVAPLEYPKGPQLPPRRAAPVDLPMPTPQPPQHFLMRVSRLGPLVPARLSWTDAEPDQPDNKLDRGRLSVFPRADIAGEEVPPEQLDERTWAPLGHWKFCRAITAAEYAYQIEHLRWSARNRPDDPRLNPRRAIDPNQLPLPSFDRENAL